MPRPSLDEYWLSMVPLVAARCTCPRRQVGAILVDAKGQLVSTGYNGNPSGLGHCVDIPCPGAPSLGGQRSDCQALHAEANAVAQAMGSRRAPWTLYCALTPCHDCSKLLLAVGVREIVALERYAHDDRGPRLLNKAGVGVWVWKDGERTPWATKEDMKI
jgi:dCMP deaminase